MMGALELNFKAENTQNLQNFVQYADLVVTWPNRSLSGEFHGEVVNTVESEGLVAIGPKNFLSDEIRVIRGKCSFVALGIDVEF